MSTNYYFVNIIDRELSRVRLNQLKSYLNQLKENLVSLGIDEDYVNRKVEEYEWDFEFDYEELHIGKRSSGWKPLFQNQEQYYGISGMKEWYENNKKEYQIEDEYGNILTWEQLEEELINWNGSKSHIDNIKRNHRWLLKSYEEIEGYEWCFGEFL